MGQRQGRNFEKDKGNILALVIFDQEDWPDVSRTLDNELPNPRRTGPQNKEKSKYLSNELQARLNDQTEPEHRKEMQPSRKAENCPKVRRRNSESLRGKAIYGERRNTVGSLPWSAKTKE